jgi:hypothetical protein
VPVRGSSKKEWLPRKLRVDKIAKISFNRDKRNAKDPVGQKG